MSLFLSLKREQKESIVLLQIGTFLEYFDLMLYVHMAVLLNELFFPKTDPYTASLLAALTFCTTFIMRPIGALIIGYIGDHFGRKPTVVLTTIMMSFSCILMANAPTYAQVGIAASWIVILCRMLQGFSSMGEIVGAEIYLTETTTPPARYPIVALVDTFGNIGGMAALAVASWVTFYNVNWRIAFWFGAIIAIVGSIARARLRETPDFVDMKRRIKKVILEADESGYTRAAALFKKTNPLWHEQINKKTIVAYFLIECATPLFFYFTYIYCGGFLKETFSYTAGQIIHHNLIVSMFDFSVALFIVFLSYKIYPLKILKAKLMIFTPFILLSPFILGSIHNPYGLLMLQLFMVSFSPCTTPAGAIFYSHFPIFRRFTYASFIFACSRALLYIISSFGLVYVSNRFGYGGILLVIIPVITGYAWGICHFEKLENSREPSLVPSEKLQSIIHPDAA